MQTRRSLLALFGSVAFAGPVAAELPPNVVGHVQNYLNGVRTLRARFTQIDDASRIARGRVYIQRPGRLRFEYDPPEQLLLVATDWRLIMYDGETDQTTTLPVDRTPLGVLLDDPIRLTGEVTIRSIAEVDDQLELTVFKTAEPGLGTLELYFDLRPMALRRWRVRDAQGKTTEILLEDVETNIELRRDLFMPESMLRRG